MSDERSREQVAAVVVDLLRLDCTGGALLTALRYGAPLRLRAQCVIFEIAADTLKETR